MTSLVVCIVAAGAAALTPTGLRCEYLADPVGIDSGRPRLSWVLESADRGQAQTAYQVHVASAADMLAEKGDLWDSGKVGSSEQNQIEYAGAPLVSHQPCFWSVRVWDKAGQASGWSKPAQWTMGVVRPEDWKASWISATTEPAGPLPLFRRQFGVTKAVRRALLYVCGLGFHEVRLNGQRVTDAVFEPGWTNYRKTCLYSTYDVTGAIKNENVLGVMLGNGMYNVEKGRYTKFTGTFGPLKLIAQLHVEYEDGSSEDIVSDESWKCAPGPIVFSSIYGGEDYDATRELPGWDAPGFDDSAWKPAVKTDGPGGKLSSAGAPPIKVMQALKSSVVKLPNGAYVYDVGQNMSGRPCIKVRGARGATVKLTPGELLGEDGQVSQKSSGGPVWFSYTLKGEGEETWRPQFTYYGFRYVQVEGARPGGEPGADLPELIELTGEFTHSSADVVGAFECSNPLVNRVHALILAAIKSNLQSVLTDCPHREKLGWLEVSHLIADGIMYNFDAARFYAKVEQDITDSQTDTGLVPDIAPEYTVFNGGFRDSPEWGSASVINPWYAYVMYGDRRALEVHYDTMRRYVEYLGSTAKDHIVSHGLGDWYDIGPKNPGESQLTSKGVTATAVYYQDLTMLAKVARVLGKDDDAKTLSARAGEVRKAFNDSFYDAQKKQYDRNSQTANAMPVVLGLAEDSERGAVLGGLVKGIEDGRYRVTAGDVGFSYLVKALTDAEQGDLLYRMVCQEEGPGYAMQLAKGATTLTEAWDADPRSSNNHCMLGHVAGWFYRGLAGIREDESAPAFKHFVLRPQMPEGLEWVKAHYDSVRGRIESEWRVNGGNVEWKFTVPPNTTATVYLPGARIATTKESGKPLAEASGLSGAREDGGVVLLQAASGSYRFSW